MSMSGVLNINKPPGLTSHDVVSRVRKLAKQRKVGHAGTLDPLATGVLLVCLGQATRLIEYLVAGRKRYRAVIRFGVVTTTHDAEGEVVAERDIAALTEAQLREALPAFIGNISQVPPIYSALKQGGRPLYERARAGEAVQVEARAVVIDDITWVAWEPPHLTVDVACGPGTYIRALAYDIGEAVGTGAHLAGLTRTAVGVWTIGKSVDLDTLAETWPQPLHGLAEAVAHLPAVTLDEDTVQRVQQGQQVRLDEAPTADLIRAHTPAGDLLAILTVAQPGDTLWQPKKVFHLTN